VTAIAKYSESGLVNTKHMFMQAMEGRSAIPAYNFNNMEQLQAILMGCSESRSPVILQCSGSAIKYMNSKLLRLMVKGAVEMMVDLGGSAPVALHLDHGDTFELCSSCIDFGFSSVMIDGSHHSFEENVELTKKVVDYAHEREVTVEGELGVLAGVEDAVSSDVSHYTKPSEVEEFVGRTSVGSLAISIGTSHGAHKFKVKPGEEPPSLRFDILEEVERRIPGFPIVLHGASTVMPEYVAMINKFGARWRKRSAYRRSS
jgi:fructose-bisphosphate aldolase class II